MCQIKHVIPWTHTATIGYQFTGMERESTKLPYGPFRNHDSCFDNNIARALRRPNSDDESKAETVGSKRAFDYN